MVNLTHIYALSGWMKYSSNPYFIILMWRNLFWSPWNLERTSINRELFVSKYKYIGELSSKCKITEPFLILRLLFTNTLLYLSHSGFSQLLLNNFFSCLLLYFFSIIFLLSLPRYFPLNILNDWAKIWMG